MNESITNPDITFTYATRVVTLVIPTVLFGISPVDGSPSARIVSLTRRIDSREIERFHSNDSIMFYRWKLERPQSSSVVL
jgi:hypothetical protein